MIDDPRYARQLVLRGFGPAAQQRLHDARVLVVGAGGLGSPALMYLAAAGVGALTLVDHDTVDLTNLHRQLLYATPDVGRSKLAVARERLAAINPHVALTTHEAKLSAANAADLVRGHDVVIDATDNFPARYAINDACVAAGVPFVYGSVARFEGQLSVFGAPDGPCYRCLFPVPPMPGTVPTCAEEGVLGVVPGVLGLYQATEALKLIAGVGTPLVGTLLLLDLLSHDVHRIQVARRADCPSCAVASTSSTSAAAVTPSDRVPLEVTPTELAALRAAAAAVTVLDVREPWEVEMAALPGSVYVPLRTLPSAVNQLDPDAHYVVLCHHGMRSEMATSWLRSQGFARVQNLVGGIEAWSAAVDPSVPRY